MVDLLCASSELVSLLQLVKPPLIYVLRGHDNWHYMSLSKNLLRRFYDATLPKDCAPLSRAV